MTLNELNAMPQADFTRALTGVFEHSLWVPERSWRRRPFADVAALHQALCAVVAEAASEERLALICAHPRLAAESARREALTACSTQEQRGAGLDDCAPDEAALLIALNEAYECKFGFPFILAVRGHTRASILTALAARLEHSPDAEIAEALRQIERIAAWRLADIVSDPTTASRTKL
jgi:2-oxo-4-hydroxy-4-carboxy-5-ureidoimidazoline decarboxylase